jgi:hypothetical protein
MRERVVRTKKEEDEEMEGGDEDAPEEQHRAGQINTRHFHALLLYGRHGSNPCRGSDVSSDCVLIQGSKRIPAQYAQPQRGRRIHITPTNALLFLF